MATRIGPLIGSIVPVMLLTVAPALAVPASCQLEVLKATAAEERVIEQYDRAIDEYVLLHRRIERPFLMERMFVDAEEMFAVTASVRRAIIAARPDAKRGDIFTESVSQVFRERLLRAIRWHRHDPAEILADNRAERLPGAPMPRIHEPFPWSLGVTMWPTLLRVLPELADELEYRFVDRDLVLIDVHADLVIDILENALPAAEHAVP